MNPKHSAQKKTPKKAFWEACAPSNIALIKYIGKKDKTNRPSGPSLSYTLDHLTSTVRLKQAAGPEDSFKPLKPKNYFTQKELPDYGKQRFLKFFQFLKQTFQLPGAYLVESGGNVPYAAGCASSASSFAALTLCAYKAACTLSLKKENLKPLDLKKLSALSRQGSGSSCRSFFRPWALWNDTHAEKINIPFPRLIHQAVLTDTKPKLISSSKAHKQASQSPLFKTRAKRAKQRLTQLITALKTKHWKHCFEICWNEFQDLHQLYESSYPPIYYRNQKSFFVLEQVQKLWKDQQDGPLTTMDAGSSVHLLYRPNQKKMAENFSNTLKKESLIILSQSQHLLLRGGLNPPIG